MNSDRVNLELEPTMPKSSTVTLTEPTQTLGLNVIWLNEIGTYQKNQFFQLPNNKITV